MTSIHHKLVEKVEVPPGVSLDIKGTDVKVSSSGVMNARHFRAGDVVLKHEGNTIEVYSVNQRKDSIAEARTIASHIHNMITGTQKTFEARLEIVYSHFPINIAVKGSTVEVSNLTGQKSPKKARVMGDSKVDVKGKEITVKGRNKEDVAQTAANLEQVTRPRGKDLRIFSDGIYITQKVKAT